MKFISIITGLLITGGILFSPGRKNLKGVWRIDNAQGDCNNPVIRIKMHQGIWNGTMDNPGQKKYDQDIRSVHNEKDSVEIKINEFQTIRAKWNNDSSIAGVMRSGEVEMKIEMTRQ